MRGRTGLGPGFTRLWAAAGISNLGDGVMGAAFPLLVASITRDPLLVAGATVANRIPWFLFALVSGALVDRMDRRKVMIGVDSFRAALIGLLGGLLLAGDVGLPVVYVAAFLLGSAETMFDTASEAIVPGLVGPQHLESANGRLQAVEWAANSFAGPPLGAALFAVAAGGPFLFDAATFAAAAILVAGIPGSFRSRERIGIGAAGLRTDIAEGLHWLWRHTVLRSLSIMAGITNMAGTAIIAIFVLFAQDILGLGDVGFGLLLATVGVGGLVGALTASAVARRIGQGTTLLMSVVLMAAITLVMGFTSSPLVAGVIAAMFGLLISLWNVVAVSLRQGLTPDPLRGRVAGVARLLAWGTQPLGALMGGVIAEAIGLRGPFFIAGAVWAVMFLVAAPIVNNRTIAEVRARVAD
jgi:MFS family permease